MRSKYNREEWEMRTSVCRGGGSIPGHSDWRSSARYTAYTTSTELERNGMREV